MAAVPVPDRPGEVIGVIVLHTAGAARVHRGRRRAAHAHRHARRRRDRGRAALRAGARARARAHPARRGARGGWPRRRSTSGIHEAATAGARSLLPADLCQLFRLEAGGRRAAARRLGSARRERAAPAAAARCCSSCSRRGRGRRRRRAGCGPGFEDAALLTTPLEASGEQLGLLCVLARAPRRFGEGDEELLRALADQTAMGARARRPDRPPDGARPRQGPVRRARGRRGRRRRPARRAAGLRPHAAARRARGAGAARRQRRRRGLGGGRGPARRAPARPRPGRLLRRAAASACAPSCCIPDARGAAERVRGDLRRGRRGRARRARPERAPCRGVADTRRALDEAARAASIARTLRPGGGAMAYEQLGAYKYLAALEPDETPRDRHWTAVEALARARPPPAHGAARHAGGVPRPAALDRRDGARALHPPEHAAPAARRIERVSGLELAREDLLALELAIKLVRLDAARRARSTPERRVRLDVALRVGDRAQRAVELGAGERRQRRRLDRVVGRARPRGRRRRGGACAGPRRSGTPRAAPAAVAASSAPSRSAATSRSSVREIVTPADERVQPGEIGDRQHRAALEVDRAARRAGAGARAAAPARRRRSPSAPAGGGSPGARARRG